MENNSNTKLKNPANNPDFIPGIYNYCDRWCERCSFTSKCLNYAMQKRNSPEHIKDKEKESKNEIFWQDLIETLDETIELLKDLMKEKGIDPDNLSIDETYEEKEAEILKATKKHPLTHLANTYVKITKGWFHKMQDILYKTGIFSEEPDEVSASANTSGIREAIDVVRWYMFQIDVKIQRGLQGKQRSDTFVEDSFLYDSNGSVKVALLGIDRSLAAWNKLLVYFPKEEDTIVNIMILLGSLRIKTEKEFPDARKFIRPGFDETVRKGQ